MTATDETPDPPDVTIVVVPRERFCVSLRSLESLYANTPGPVDLVYVDGGSPAPLRRQLEAEADRRGFRLVRADRYLSPNQARNLGVRHATGRHVVFVDNDVLVEPGWLDALVTCADETGAWVVGPLAFEGRMEDERVHNAGGFWSFEGPAGQRDLVQDNRYGHKHLSELPEGLVRLPVDYVEFHCVLVRRDVFDRIGPLDEALLSTREHLDLCLAVHAADGEVWSALDARVTYENPPPVPVGELAFFLLRWSEAWNLASLRHFSAKHDLGPAYLERTGSGRSRRHVLFRPVRRAVEARLGATVESYVTRGLMAVEHLVNLVVVGAMARRLARRPVSATVVRTGRR